jgi:hypothetical protein
MPGRSSILAGPHRRFMRTAMIRLSVRGGVRNGDECGRLERSSIQPDRAHGNAAPNAPPVDTGTWKRSAAPAQTPVLINDACARYSRPRGVNRALRVGHEGLHVWNRTPGKPHSTRRSSSCHQTTPSVTNVRGQYTWSGKIRHRPARGNGTRMVPPLEV